MTSVEDLLSHLNERNIRNEELVNSLTKEIEKWGPRLDTCGETMIILRAKVDQLALTDKQYCEKLSKAQERIRDLENWKNKLVGYFAAIATIGGAVGAVLTLILTGS